MVAAKTDMRLFPPFYPPEGPERAPDLDYELPDGMLQGPHIHRTTQSDWENFYEIERPNVLPPMLAFDAPVYYRNEQGQIRHVVPDWFFAFNINARAVRARNGYFAEEVGKGPDVVFEVGSPTTYENDLGRKRRVYQRMGAGEYWGFDPTGGEYYGAPIFGWILVDGEYVEVEVEYDENTGDARAYSPALDMYVCAIYEPEEFDDDEPNDADEPAPAVQDDYQLRFLDRRTGQYLMTPKELADGFRMRGAALGESEAALGESEAELRESETARGWLESELNIERAARGRLESELNAQQAARGRLESELNAQRAARNQAESEREDAQARIRKLEKKLRRYQE